MKILGKTIGQRDPDDDMDPDERDALLKKMVEDSLLYAQGKEPEAEPPTEPQANPE